MGEADWICEADAIGPIPEYYLRILDCLYLPPSFLYNTTLGVLYSIANGVWDIELGHITVHTIRVDSTD